MSFDNAQFIPSRYKGKYECPMCECRFPNIGAKKAHMKLEHSDSYKVTK